MKLHLSIPEKKNKSKTVITIFFVKKNNWQCKFWNRNSTKSIHIPS